MQKKNVWILLACLGMIAAVAFASLKGKIMPSSLPDQEMDQAAGYVYITAGGQGKWFALPEEESRIQLKRQDEKGNEIRNVIALTPEGVYMQESTCENQDCVHQGKVTLENKNDRVLKNMILCLPNNVTIELYSAQEMENMQE